MNVRAATPADAPGIAAVHVRTWQAAYRHAFPDALLDGLSLEEHEQWWRGVVDGESEHVWVADDGGTVVGFASAGPSRSEQDVGELFALYVLPEAWGSGTAHALMNAVLGWLLAEEYTTAMLWVLEDNPRARAFYEREGWRFDRVEEQSVRGHRVMSALYRLTLAGA